MRQPGSLREFLNQPRLTDSPTTPDQHRAAWSARPPPGSYRLEQICQLGEFPPPAHEATRQSILQKLSFK
jgi:hypothetical protein